MDGKFKKKAAIIHLCFQRVREKNMRENKAEKKKSKYVLTTERKDHEKPNEIL